VNDKKKAKHKSELFFKATLLTSFFSRQNEDNDDTLWFRIENLLSMLEKLLIQFKYKSNNVIDYQEQSDSLLWLKTKLATLPNQEMTVQLCYFFVKENWEWLTIHKNVYSSLHNRGRIMERKGVYSEVYWLQTAKLLNRAEKSEKKPKYGGKISLLWPSHLLHRDSSMHPTYTHGKCDAYQYPWREGTMVECGLLMQFLITVCSTVQGFRPSK